MVTASAAASPVPLLLGRRQLAGDRQRVPLHTGAEFSWGKAGLLKVPFPRVLRLVLVLLTRRRCQNEESRNCTGFWRFFVGFFYWHSCFLQSFDVFESAFIITYCSCSDSHLFCPSISLSESSVQ